MVSSSVTTLCRRANDVQRHITAGACRAAVVSKVVPSDRQTTLNVTPSDEITAARVVMRARV